MQAPEAATTRERILEVALELFSTQGYVGASIRDIAERMSMTKAAVYYHFPSKEALLVDVISPSLMRVRGVLEAHQAAQTIDERRALVSDLVEVVAAVGPRVLVMLSDPAVGGRIREIAGGADLPELVAQALIGSPEQNAGDAAAHRVRAACAVACLPAGIAAWRQDNPEQTSVDEQTKQTLVQVVLGVLASDDGAAPHRD